jgi:thiamine-phosphate pyrophosphorylase
MTLAEAARRLKPHRPPAAGLPRLLLVTDAARLPDPLAALARLPPGCGVLLRHYDAGGRADLARSVVAAARRRRLPVLVAGDWRLAAAVGAAGLHLPEGMLRSGRLAAALGWARRRRRLVTAACHSPAALARAGRLGLTAALLSPVFATASHPGAATLGPLRFARWCRRAPLPVMALGGISGRTARRLAASGAAGLAALEGLMR